MLPTPVAHAQVQLDRDGDTVTLTNARGTSAVLVRSMVGSRATWSVLGGDGHRYQTGIGDYDPTPQNAGGDGGADGDIPDDGDDEVIIHDGYQGSDGGADGDIPDDGDDEVIIIDGYQGSDGGADGDIPDDGDDEVIIIDGYQDVLDLLVNDHGVALVHDEDLGLDLLTLPDADDPIGAFFDLIATAEHNGIPLYRYFRVLEVGSLGAFGPEDGGVLTTPAPYAFPDDPYYDLNWGVRATNFDRALWHPAVPSERIKLSVVDSGIDPGERYHDALGGARVSHRKTIRGSIRGTVSHGLSMVSILTDAGNNGEGFVGLLARWDGTACYPHKPVFERKKPRVLSWAVGNTTPSTIAVARAIKRSVRQDVDVINLSFRTAPSPVIEEAVANALEAGVVVVAAAGNYHPDSPSKPLSFPASIDGVIAVGAGDATGATDGLSATGSDVLAPGTAVVTAYTQGRYTFSDGTSFAAAYVSAAAALLRAYDQTLGTEAIRDILRATARDDDGDGIGFLDAFAALNAVLPSSEQVTDLPAPHETCGGGSVLGGRFAAYKTGEQAPKTLGFEGSYPEPFQSQATLRFTLPEAADVRLVVYNTLGQEVQRLMDEPLSEGVYTATLDASSLPSGLYFARLTTPTGTVTQRMTLVR